MSTAAGASMAAHAVHYAVVLGGLAGLALLLLPHVLERLGLAAAPAPSAHDERVRRLRDLAATGRLAEPGATLTAVRRPVTRAGSARAPRAGALLPVALVSSAAAAGVHAAVGPAHLADQPLVGLFFLACAAGQLGWTALFLLRPQLALLEAAVVGNAALLTLWAVSRLSGSEPVGPWDLAAGGWELTVVLACLGLGAPARLRAPAWSAWPPVARAWFAGSALLLVALSLSGAGA